MNRRKLHLRNLLAGLMLASSSAYSQGPMHDLQQLIGEYSQFVNLNLEDLSFGISSNQWMTISATTSAFNSSASILVASFPTTGPKAGHMVAIKPQNFSLANYFQEATVPVISNLPLNDVALILSDGSLSASADELPDDVYSFFVDALGTPDFYLILKRGLNIIALVRADQLTPDGPLKALMDKLGVGGGTIFLQGAIGKRIEDLYLMAVFPPMRPQGSPAWFRSGQLAVELTGQPSVSLVGGIAVEIDQQVLDFFVKTKAGREGLVLVGGMIAEGGWESPFGIQGFTMNKVVLLLGVTPTGSVQLGFEGDLVIGTKDMRTAVLVALNAATGAPTNAMFDGESEEGFGLSDIVALQSKMAAARTGGSGPEPLSLENMPTLDIKKAKLKFAPKDSPELGISRGMTIGGRLLLRAKPSSPPKMLADALFDVGDHGIIARGEIGKFQLGPVKMDEAKIDLTMTRDDQHFLIGGHADLSFMKSDLDVSFTKTSILFDASGKIFNLFEADLYAHGKIDFTNPKFDVRAKLKNDFNERMTQLFSEELPPIVTSNRNKAKKAADDAEKDLDKAEKARNAAFKKWQDTPVLPRDPKVAARKKLEEKAAVVAKKRTINIAKQAEFTKWDLAKRALDQQQSGGERLIVVQKGEFEADLGSLVGGSVKKLEMTVKVRGKEKYLSLTSWSFKDIRKSLKVGVRQIAQNLFDS